MPTQVPLINPAQRLFLALWPDEAARWQLADHARHWAWPVGCAPYLPLDWHITLHYIGPVDAARVPELVTRAAVTLQPFDLVLDQPVIWPHGLAVLCANQVPPQLVTLLNQLRQVLHGLGLPVQTRPYRPHVTLARHAQAATAPESLQPVRWCAGGYALVESTGDTALRYRVLRQYP